MSGWIDEAKAEAKRRTEEALRKKAEEQNKLDRQIAEFRSAVKIERDKIEALIIETRNQGLIVGEAKEGWSYLNDPGAGEFLKRNSPGHNANTYAEDYYYGYDVYCLVWEIEEPSTKRTIRVYLGVKVQYPYLLKPKQPVLVPSNTVKEVETQIKNWLIGLFKD